MKAKQISSIVPSKFARKSLGGKRSNNKKDKGEEEVVAARTAELKAMSVADMKELALQKGLEKGLKGEMMESILAQEAKEREAARASEAKLRDVVTAHKKELESKSIPELKELCEAKSLALGGSKTDKVERLAAAAIQDGTIARIIADAARASRRE